MRTQATRASLEQIDDIVGVRVITFFPEAVEAVQNAIATRHPRIEWSDKREQLRRSERFGYQSIHGVITLTEGDCPNAELVGLKVELQIRTILQHAWAEIEHDVQYKETQVRDADTRRRFLLLAAQLESIDRELQSIHDDHRALRQRAREDSGAGDAPIERSAVRAVLEQACPGAPSASDDELDWILTRFERLGMTSMEDVWRYSARLTSSASTRRWGSATRAVSDATSTMRRSRRSVSATSGSSAARPESGA